MLKGLKFAFVNIIPSGLKMIRLMTMAKLPMFNSMHAKYWAGKTKLEKNSAIS